MFKKNPPPFPGTDVSAVPPRLPGYTGCAARPLRRCNGRTRPRLRPSLLRASARRLGGDLPCSLVTGLSPSPDRWETSWEQLLSPSSPYGHDLKGKNMLKIQVCQEARVMPRSSPKPKAQRKNQFPDPGFLFSESGTLNSEH